MASTTTRRLFSLFGLVAWGDLGDLTMYRRKDGRLVIFKKTWPDKPPSTAQLTHRARYTDAALAWQALTPDKRTAWRQAAARASLCMTGYNLFLHHQLSGDDSAIATLERQTSTSLLP
jgi:hypothetical protein